MNLECVLKGKEIDIPADCAGCQYYDGQCRHEESRKSILRAGRLTEAFGLVGKEREKSAVKQ